MKTNVRKTLCLSLALLLILSALPMAVLADDNISPALELFCPDGRHQLAYIVEEDYTDCGSVIHRVDVYNRMICANCPYFYNVELLSSEYKAHEYTKTCVGKDPDTEQNLYLYECACGYFKYDE